MKSRIVLLAAASILAVLVVAAVTATAQPIRPPPGVPPQPAAQLEAYTWRGSGGRLYAVFAEGTVPLAKIEVWPRMVRVGNATVVWDVIVSYWVSKIGLEELMQFNGLRRPATPKLKIIVNVEGVLPNGTLWPRETAVVEAPLNMTGTVWAAWGSFDLLSALRVPDLTRMRLTRLTVAVLLAGRRVTAFGAAALSYLLPRGGWLVVANLPAYLLHCSPKWIDSGWVECSVYSGPYSVNKVAVINIVSATRSFANTTAARISFSVPYGAEKLARLLKPKATLTFKAEADGRSVVFEETYPLAPVPRTVIIPDDVLPRALELLGINATTWNGTVRLTLTGLEVCGSLDGIKQCVDLLRCANLSNVTVVSTPIYLHLSAAARRVVVLSATATRVAAGLAEATIRLPEPPVTAYYRLDEATILDPLVVRSDGGAEVVINIAPKPNVSSARVVLVNTRAYVVNITGLSGVGEEPLVAQLTPGWIACAPLRTYVTTMMASLEYKYRLGLVSKQEYVEGMLELESLLKQYQPPATVVVLKHPPPPTPGGFEVLVVDATGSGSNVTVLPPLMGAPVYRLASLDVESSGGKTRVHMEYVVAAPYDKVYGVQEPSKVTLVMQGFSASECKARLIEVRLPGLNATKWAGSSGNASNASNPLAAIVRTITTAAGVAAVGLVAVGLVGAAMAGFARRGSRR